MMVLTVFVGLFMYDNAEFISDVQDKHQRGYEFAYVGKQEVRPDVPNLPLGDKIYFSMEK